MSEETPQDRVRAALERGPRKNPEPVKVRHVELSAGDLVDLLRAQPDPDDNLRAVLEGNESLPRDRPVAIPAEFAEKLAGSGRQQPAAEEPAPAPVKRGKQQPAEGG